METEKRTEIAAQEKKEARKERVGTDLVARSLARTNGGSSGSGEEDNDEDNGSAEEERNGRKKRRKVRHRQADALDGELESVGNAMKEADLVRIDLEKQRLVFERVRFDIDKQDREREREMKREERQAQNELELKKFKMMMGAFMQAKK